MCLPNSKLHGYDALDWEIDSQEYLDEEFDTYDYVDINSSIATAKEDLVILQHNIRGVTSKKEKLKNIIDNYLENTFLDVILLCETWLNPFSPNLPVPG